MGLTAKSFVILACCAVLGTILSLYGFHSQVQRNHLALAADRLNIIANDLRRDIEARVQLDMPLLFLQEVQAAIERQRAQSQGVTSISMFGQDRTILLATDRSAIGQRVPPDWLASDGTLPDMTWTLIRDEGVLVGVPISNSFNRTVGGLVLTVSRQSADSGGLGFYAAITGVGLAGLAISLIIGWIGTRQLGGPVAISANQALDQLIRLRRADMDDLPHPPPPNDDVPLAEAIRHSRATLNCLHEGNDAVRELDQLA